MNRMNEILHNLQALTEGIPKNSKLTERVKKSIYDYLKGENLTDTQCKIVSKWLVFQGNRKGSLEELVKVDWFNRVRKTDIGTKRKPFFLIRRNQM